MWCSCLAALWAATREHTNRRRVSIIFYPHGSPISLHYHTVPYSLPLFLSLLSPILPPSFSGPGPQLATDVQGKSVVLTARALGRLWMGPEPKTRDVRSGVAAAAEGKPIVMANVSRIRLSHGPEASAVRNTCPPRRKRHKDTIASPASTYLFLFAKMDTGREGAVNSSAGLYFPWPSASGDFMEQTATPHYMIRYPRALRYCHDQDRRPRWSAGTQERRSRLAPRTHRWISARLRDAADDDRCVGDCSPQLGGSFLFHSGGKLVGG